MPEEPSADELSAQLNQFLAAGTAAAARLAADRRLPIEYRHIQEALEEVLMVDGAEHLLREHLDAPRMVDLLRD